MAYKTLLEEVEEFLALDAVGNADITATGFGIAVLHDGKFVAELRGGRQVKESTAIAVRKYMHDKLVELGVVAPYARAI